MDNLLTLLGVAGCNFVMGIPGSDDIMLNYQSTSFHDALYLRRVLELKHAPEFAVWLQKQGIADADGNIRNTGEGHKLFSDKLYQALITG
jgi:ethanolamine ammonia-lyase large subunit